MHLTNLSIRQIYCKAFHSTEVIVWCIWVLRLVKYYNLVATKCQYFSPLTVGTDLYLLHVSKLYEHKEYTEGYLWNKAQFYIYTQKNVLRKSNRHKSQTRVIKGIRIKPHIIFSNNWCQSLFCRCGILLMYNWEGEEALRYKNPNSGLEAR